MSLALSHLGRLGRVVMLKEAAHAEAMRHDSTSYAGGLPSGNFRRHHSNENFIHSAKCRLLILLVAFISLMTLTAAFLIDQWNGVVYAAIGITVFIILPAIITRIVMISRARTKQTLKFKKEQLQMSIATLNLAGLPPKLTCSMGNLDKILAQCPELKKNSTNEMKIQKSSMSTLNSFPERLGTPDKEKLGSKRSSSSSASSATNNIGTLPVIFGEDEVSKINEHETQNRSKITGKAKPSTTTARNVKLEIHDDHQSTVNMEMIDNKKEER